MDSLEDYVSTMKIEDQQQLISQEFAFTKPIDNTSMGSMIEIIP
jgi:hypothetical protein